MMRHLNELLPYYVRCKSNSENKVVKSMIVNFILGKPNEAHRLHAPSKTGLSPKAIAALGYAL